MSLFYPREDPLLAEVEALMVELATGADPEVAGRIVCEHLATGGKRLRARLALSAVAALGGDATGAVGWGAACELLHNATLVHDDIQDGDRVRRNAPTAWARHGIPQALNAGDLLFLLPFEAIGRLTCAAGIRFALSAALAQQGGAVIRGQAAEVELTTGDTVAVEAYLRAIEGKTSALFELPVEGAALIAGLDQAGAAAVKRPFHLLGMLFQLQDDVLDLFGDKGREAPGSDLREGKVSALVVEHLAAHPQDRDGLLGILRAPRDATPEDGIRDAIVRFRDGGALAAVLARIKDLADRARGDVALVGHPALADLMVELTDQILTPIEHLVRTG